MALGPTALPVVCLRRRQWGAASMTSGPDAGHRARRPGCPTPVRSHLPWCASRPQGRLDAAAVGPDVVARPSPRPGSGTCPRRSGPRACGPGGRGSSMTENRPSGSRLRPKCPSKSASLRYVVMASSRATASPSSPRRSMSQVWTRFQAMAMGPVAAGAAMGATRSVRSGRRRATSSATMPPSEPPVTRAMRSMPSSSASCHRARAWSRVVTSGKRPPHGSPVAGSVVVGPVEPYRPPRRLAHSTPMRAVSSASPGPMTGAHQSPAASAEPVSACTTSTWGASPGPGRRRDARP